MVSEYIPQAPVNDEAKKHNQQLPGMGGVFNVVNLQLYHYAGNNPVKYIDPDGHSVFAAAAIIVWSFNGMLLAYGTLSSIGPSRAEHLSRNNFQAGMAPSNKNIMDGLVSVGLFENWGNTGTHNLSGEDSVANRFKSFVGGKTGTNVDYRGSVGTVFEGCQFVYDSKGNLVIDTLNQGTYDTKSPNGVTGKIKHFTFDVVPWLKWGNGTANNQIMSSNLQLSIENVLNDFNKGNITKDQAKAEIESIVKNFKNSAND